MQINFLCMLKKVAPGTNMLKNSSLNALDRFIDGLGLRNPDKIISFNAHVDMSVNSGTIRFTSNVQIITSNSLATIYIISNDFRPGYMPDMFDPSRYTFSYIDGKGLEIISIDPGEHHQVFIFPIF